MTGRELDVPPATPKTIGDLTLLSSPNWTAVIFFACLGGLHLLIAIPTLMKLRWEGHMSLALGVAFIAAALVTTRARSHITFDSRRRVIRIRSGVGRFCFVRRIGFDDVHAVRVTIAASDRPRTRVEVLCDNEDIECPPTVRPREEALCLALLLNVQLIKVWADSTSEAEHAARV